MIRLLSALIVLAATLVASVAAQAQPLGTYRWQLRPYCNVVSLAVTQNGAVYEIEGTDDQCGAAKAASAIGTAFLNPDGTVGFGLNIVTSPSGAPVHVEASINLSNLSGTWHDSAGASGAFVLTQGAGVGGDPRPAGGGTLEPGSVTSTSIAPQAVGSSQVNASQVQLRIGNGCPGQFIQSVSQSGSVTCAQVISGAGLTTAGSAGGPVLSLNRTQNGAFKFDNSDGFVSAGTLNSGSIPISGPGTRAMWYPRKAAFRAGNVVGTQWDDANIGSQSVAFGSNTTASGVHSFAVGDSSIASGPQGVALGYFTTAAGSQSVALGATVTASGAGSVVLGSNALAAGTGSFAFGDRSTASKITAFDHQFVVRAIGGSGFYTKYDLSAGVELAAGASSWSSVSDVNMKENFRDLAGEDVLTKIARMPIRECSYKAQDAAIRHIGPTAQDFYGAFGLGESTLRISTIDADGIALRAIQALEARTTELQRENDALRAALSAVQQTLEQLAHDRR